MSIYFLENKYTNTYYRIISRAQSREKPNTYTEKHHIIPRSLGGSNSKDNLAALTAKEHFVCHHLLIRMVEGDHKRKMVHALNGMCRKYSNQERYIPSATVYAQIREYFGSIMKNRIVSPETRAKISASKKGKKLSPETRAKISSGQIGRPPTNKGQKHSPETRAKMSAVRKGKKKAPFTPEHCANISAAKKQKTIVNQRSYSQGSGQIPQSHRPIDAKSTCSHEPFAFGGLWCNLCKLDVELGVWVLQLHSAPTPRTPLS